MFELWTFITELSAALWIVDYKRVLFVYHHVSSFSFIAFTIMCFVPGSSCRGSQWRSWIRSCTCMCGQHLLLSGFWSFSAYQEEDWRNSPQGLLFCVCACVRVCEREREGGKLYLVKDSLENHTDLVLNYGRDKQTVATMWSPPIKFQDRFFSWKAKWRCLLTQKVWGQSVLGHTTLVRLPQLSRMVQHSHHPPHL